MVKGGPFRCYNCGMKMLAHLRGTYYRGSLLVLARYARGNLGAASEYARKVAVGIHLVLRREISPAAFVAANTLAFAELRRSEEPR